jgi:hypothetical protein
MRIKLKKVTVASPNAPLVQTLVFLSFIPRSTTMQKQLHKIKIGICLNTVRTRSNVSSQLVAFAKGR